MARKHKKRRSGPRRARRSRRYSRRRFGFVRNDSGVGGEILTALLAGGGGYVLARGLSSVGMRFLPAMVPERELVSNALAGGAVTFGAEMLMKAMPGPRKAVIVGAWVPTAEGVVNRVGLGRMIGTERFVMLPGPVNAPASPGVSAALEAALEASLDDPYHQPY